jgi:hypothetical protein
MLLFISFARRPVMMINRAFAVLLMSISSAWCGDTANGIGGQIPAVPLAAPDNHADIATVDKPEGVQWTPLILQSLKFLAIEHGFRYLTEPQTRDPGMGFFGGYVDSLTNLHGWGDGDPFYVNYVGHPMQGAVSGFIWVQNDRRFRYAEFGRNHDYWKSRLRAAAFSWVYSTQMEIGPLSEASIGHIQASLPQQGFVDQVITPSIGLGWLLTEDAMDHYVIRFLEQKSTNRVYRAMYRSALNPSRSLANVIGGQWPWARPRDSQEYLLARRRPAPDREIEVPRGVPPFELALNTLLLHGTKGPCIGGGASAAFRIKPQLQIVGDVYGCTMTGLENMRTGDFLTFLAGPRWTPLIAGRWHPFVQILIGGNKIAQEVVNPQLEATLDQQAQRAHAPMPAESSYIGQFAASGYTLAAGTGLDFQVNQALALRLVNLDYTRTRMHDLPGFAAPQGFQFKAGLVLRMGTW